jgi:hypothetical protein
LYHCGHRRDRINRGTRGLSVVEGRTYLAGPATKQHQLALLGVVHERCATPFTGRRTHNLLRLRGEANATGLAGRATTDLRKGPGVRARVQDGDVAREGPLIVRVGQRTEYSPKHEDFPVGYRHDRAGTHVPLGDVHRRLHKSPRPRRGRQFLLRGELKDVQVAAGTYAGQRFQEAAETERCACGRT